MKKLNAWKYISAFFAGYASCFDLFGNTTNITISRTPFKTDKEAMKGDWNNIGGDFRASLDNYKSLYLK